MPITIAVDAMGGDRAPDEIVAGAIEAADDLGVRVLLVGLEEAITPLLPASTSAVELVPTTEVVAMHDPPASVPAASPKSASASPGGWDALPKPFATPSRISTGNIRNRPCSRP